MTTLPQTTNVRMTRPSIGVGSGGMTVAGHGPGGILHAAGAGHGSGAGMTAGDVWRVLRANALFIAAMLVIFGALGFAAYRVLLKYYARYTAVGWVEITVTRPPDPLTLNRDNAYYDTNLLAVQLRKQGQLMHTDALLSKVLRDGPNIRNTSWFRQFIGKDGKPDIAAAKEDLSDKLNVTPVIDSPLIMVTMSWRDPKDCRLIVEDVVNQHLNDQRDLKTSKDQARSQDLTALKNALTLKLTQVQDDIHRLQVDLNKEGINTRGFSPRELELQEMMKSLGEATSNYNEAKGALDGMKSKIAAGETPVMVEQAAQMDQRVMVARNTVDSADLYLIQQKHYGTENPRYKIALDQRNAAQQKLDDTLAEVRARYGQELSEKFENAANGYAATVQSLTEKINQLKDALGELDFKQVQYLSKMDEERGIRESLKLVTDQLQTIAQMKNQADLAGVSWSQRPETPELPSFPKLPIILSVAIVAGLLLALGVAFTRELMDTSVRSPRDIQRVGQLNLLGMIPHQDDDPQSAGVPLPLVIYQAPTSMTAEQFRQVRTRLQHAASLDTTRSILVTSPSPQDGKSVVAANLASGLALNGRRILLVDANFRRPELHRIFNVANDIGFAGVLADVNELGAAVHQTNVPNLDVLPAGPKPGNATELLESQLLIDFIDKALEEYDHVIFDSGPMLFVSETVALAPRVDGVVTVVRARSNSRGLLQRMRDQLRQLKAEHLGVVLNAVRAQGGGYYGRNIKTYYEYQNGHAG